MSEKLPKLWVYWGWPSLVWCLGVAGMVGLWLGIAVWRNGPCTWMALLSVLDIALLLRFTGIGAGWFRFLAIFSGTVIILVFSQWLIAANAFGLAMGLFPVDAAQLVGSVLVWEFTHLRLSASDLLWLSLSIFIMLWLGFSKRF
ncbi:MAG: hypothetical protein ABI644_04030 [Arenimonas sp.]